jgi:hypothetical protein
VDDLSIEVRGVGQLRFPVPDQQARALRKIARPARYGHGQRTLLDRGVRDTWEVPRSRVRIDKRRWNRTLVPVLESVHDELGLAEGTRLEAELHSMLVYAPGQFFLPHQDSEKHDEMVGSLVVTLPGSFTGGALVVEHRGKRVSYRGSKQALSFVAFYADCRHEVKPVRSGHRIVLTYNLRLRQISNAPALPDAPPEIAGELAHLLEQHFATPLRRWPGDREVAEPPSLLVYLLDHEYTERGLGWGRLKSHDARRAALLQQVARGAGCDAVLALAKVHEIWNATPSDDSWYGRRRRGSWSECDDEEDEHDLGPDEDEYELEELVDQSVELECWMEAAATTARAVALSVGAHEVCATTASHELEPYESEYEGYMGNYGNTLDRWYRRAAVVLWPEAKAFAVRAKAEPAWALTRISARVRAGELAEARELTAALAPFWTAAARARQSSRLVAAALRVASGIDEPALARMLLAPLDTEALGRAHAAPLAALFERYGEPFFAELLDAWSAQRRHWSAPQVTHTDWVASLPRLCEALCARGPGGAGAALALVRDSSRHLAATVARTLAVQAPSRRRQALDELAPSLAAVLHSAALVGATELWDEVVGFCRAQGDELVPCVVQTLRGATLAPELRGAGGLDVLASHCVDRLAARLARPPRDEGDWSIEPPGGCDCELCRVLAGFLTDPAARSFEWPLAQQRRRHIHATIDGAELPVRHQTRRRGSPYTLVLTKTAVLFEAERHERARDQADVAWLAAAWGSEEPR